MWGTKAETKQTLMNGKRILEKYDSVMEQVSSEW